MELKHESISRQVSTQPNLFNLNLFFPRRWGRPCSRLSPFSLPPLPGYLKVPNTRTCFKPKGPNINIKSILLTVLQIISYCTAWENLFKHLDNFNQCWSFHLFSLPVYLIWQWYCYEKFDADHYWGLKKELNNFINKPGVNLNCCRTPGPIPMAWRISSPKPKLAFSISW